ncbi:Zinc finger protein ZFMSA12A [Folsomia candida]|uniref:Zinc finger protein ZFMSA12A n=1 Tax=Folsomia candida TaxID=158441 RepID=A0A226D1Y0_FOLCA|nr:Zinc finger protein ZFMSA12A [Folsomia candida]
MALKKHHHQYASLSGTVQKGCVFADLRSSGRVDCSLWRLRPHGHSGRRSVRGNGETPRPIRTVLKNHILTDTNEKFAYFQINGEEAAIIRRIAKAVRSQVILNVKRAQDGKFYQRRKPKRNKRRGPPPKATGTSGTIAGTNRTMVRTKGTNRPIAGKRKAPYQISGQFGSRKRRKNTHNIPIKPTLEGDPHLPIGLYPTLDFADALLGEEICPQFEDDPLKIEPFKPNIEPDDLKIEPDDIKIESDESNIEPDDPKINPLQIEADPDYYPPEPESGQHNDVNDNQEFTISSKNKSTTRPEKTEITNPCPKQDVPHTTRLKKLIKITNRAPKYVPLTTIAAKAKIADSASTSAKKPVPPRPRKPLPLKKPATPAENDAAFSLLPIPVTPAWTWLDFVTWRTAHAKANPPTYSRLNPPVKTPPLSWLATHFSITTFPCPHCPCNFATLAAWYAHQPACRPKNTGSQNPTPIREDTPYPIPVTPTWTWPDFVKWRKTYARTHFKKTDPPTQIPTLTWLAAHYSITTFPCPHCTQILPTLSTWTAHELYCPQNTTPGYKCPTCQKFFTNTINLEGHQRRKHLPREALTCTGCGVLFLEIVPFTAHVTAPDCAAACREAAIPCKIGPHVVHYFPTTAAFDLHIQARHPPRWALPFECPQCPKRFVMSTARDKHIATIHNSTIGVCEVCGASMKDSSLRNHMIEVHKSREPGAKRFICNICGRGLISQVKLTRHRQIHIRPEDAEHLCTQCGKRFRLKEYLDIHMYSHDPERKGYYKGRGKGDPQRRGLGGAKIGRPPVKPREDEGAEAGDQDFLGEMHAK